MSMDGLDNPVASMEQPKSGKKFWLFGGCGLGCLGLIGVVCIGGGAFLDLDVKYSISIILRAGCWHHRSLLPWSAQFSLISY